MLDHDTIQNMSIKIPPSLVKQKNKRRNACKKPVKTIRTVTTTVKTTTIEWKKTHRRKK